MSFADFFFDYDEYDDIDGVFYDIYGGDFRDHFSDHSDDDNESEASIPGDDQREPSDYERGLAQCQLPEKWAFLAPFFSAISSEVRLCESDFADGEGMMIGREPQDWWLEIMTNNSLHRDAQPTDEEAMTRLRDALYLTSLLALVDDDAWLAEMLCTQCIEPPMTLDVEFETVPPQFVYRVSTHVSQYSHNPAIKRTEDAQSKRFRHLFSPRLPDATSPEFTGCYKSICSLARERGVTTNEVATCTMPIKFIIPCDSEANSLRVVFMLDIVTSVIKEMKEATAIEPGQPPRSMFQVEEVRLELAKMKMDCVGMAALERLVSTGVHFELFMMPIMSIPTEPEEETETRFAWATLIQRLLDHESPATIEWLELNGDNISEAYMAPLFASLVHATSVESLKITMHPQQTSKYEHVWSSLAFTLFSRQSSTLIKKLMIAGIDMSDGGFVRAVAEYSVVEDPVHHLWRRSVLISEKLEATTNNSMAWTLLEKGTGVTVQGFTPGAVARVRLQADAQAWILQDDAGEDHVKALVSGVGFCHVGRAQLSAKRRRVGDADLQIVRNANRPGLQTLCLITQEPQKPPGWFPSPRRKHEWADFLKERTVIARHKLTLLLHRIGRSLTSLRLKSEFLDDATLMQLLIQCPQLQRLKLEGGKLKSLEPISGAYHRQPRCQIQALELSGKLVPMGELEAFIDLLGDDELIMSCLRKLRFGDGSLCNGFTEATGDAVRYMLEHNRQLTHLQVIKSWYTRADFGRATFHRQVLPTQPLPLRARLAFLSALLSDSFALGSDVLKLVFAFAGTPCAMRVMTVDRVGT